MVTRPSFINKLDFDLLRKKFKNEKDLLNAIEKVKNDYPIQYLIGDVEFLDNKILVNPDVLIPRFETELLVQKTINYIKEHNFTTLKILDLCTGSGCIAISLKKEFNSALVYAIDKSECALNVARLNSKVNNTEVTFLNKDILSSNDYGKIFSVLISNPPYVKLDEIVSKNTKYEPQSALYPGEDDLIFYKKILDSSKEILTSKSLIAFEIGATQASKIKDYAMKIYPNSKIIVEKDFNNFDRFIFIFNNCE